MACKCRMCGINDVYSPGDICDLCAVGGDPYAGDGSMGNALGSYQNNTYSNGTSGTKTRRPILVGNGVNQVPQTMASTSSNTYNTQVSQQFPNSNSQVQVYQNGQVPNTINNNSVDDSQDIAALDNNGPLTQGVIKNLYVDTQKKSVLVRLFRTMFKGIPFTLDNDITMFQVYPDFSGTTLTAMGTACDQVIVYGKVNAGAVAENNDVEVYGHRDSDMNIVASKIVNKATGTNVKPYRAIPVAIIWILVLAVIAACAWFVASFGVTGIIWTVILILCLTNLPLVFKILLTLCGVVLSIIGSIFRGLNRK